MSPLTTRDTGDPAIEPGETATLHHCWELDADDLGGAVPAMSAITADASTSAPTIVSDPEE